MVNDVCNLRCPYCFASEYVNGDTSTEITYKNFKEAVDWLNRSYESGGEDGRIALIGGEPTLHSRLKDLLNYALVVRKPNQQILVFTNGVSCDRFIDYFAKNDISLLINVNSSEDIGTDSYEKLVSNIRAMRQKAVSISIGINLYKANMDFDFILKIIDEFSFRELRVGLTAPNSEEKIEEGAFSYFEGIKGSLIRLAKEAGALGCGIHLDCQKLPYCVIKDDLDEIRRLEEEYGVGLSLTECSRCTPVIDILQDLTAVRCFGASGKLKPLPISSFHSESDLIGYFETNVDNIGYMVPTSEKCFNCYERNIGKCQGGCLAYKLDEINRIVTPPDIEKTSV